MMSTTNSTTITMYRTSTNTGTGALHFPAEQQKCTKLEPPDVVVGAPNDTSATMPLSEEADAVMASEILSPRPPPDDIAPDELVIFVATGGNTAHSSKRSSLALSHPSHNLACQASTSNLSQKSKQTRPTGASSPLLWKRMICCIAPPPATSSSLTAVPGVAPQSDNTSAVVAESRTSRPGRSFTCSCIRAHREEQASFHGCNKEQPLCEPISVLSPAGVVVGEHTGDPTASITSPMPGNTGKDTPQSAGPLTVSSKEPLNGATVNVQREDEKLLKALNNSRYKNTTPLLPAILPADKGKKCFVIDLDETLVHSSFSLVAKADFKVGVDIEGRVHQVYVLKRPYVEMFLQRLGPLYECVLFTASLSKYADPVTDFIDPQRYFRHRLFRDSCCFYNGNYVKDLSMLGRDVDQTVILDNSPVSYLFHNANAVHILSWFDNPADRALLDLIPYFEQLARAPNVPEFLANNAPPTSATGSSPLNRPASFAGHLRASGIQASASGQPRPLTYLQTLRHSSSGSTSNTSVGNSTASATSPSSTVPAAIAASITSPPPPDSNIITQVRKPTQ